MGRARAGTENRNAYGTLVEKSERIYNLEDGRIILKCTLKG